MAIKVTDTDSPEQKAAAWREIQELSPDMADAIKQISAVFGKLKSVEVKEK
jgi:hypothetical protein